MEAERQWVRDLVPGGTAVDGVYAVRWKEAPARYKHGYRFRMKVADATGDITLTYWGGQDEAAVRAIYDAVLPNSVIRVSGTTSEWNGMVVINVNPANDGAVTPVAEKHDPADFLPRTAKDVEEMYSVLMSYIYSIQQPHVQSLLRALFLEPEMEERFKRSPASVSYHCGWVGGLLEHTLNVVRICESVSLLYPDLDRDILLAGAIMHDVGKIHCYDLGSTISESADGRMVGHITLGSEMVGRTCDSIPDFPPNIRLKLMHMVLASHGAYEKGSPVTPSIPEAVALNYADEMDATIEGYILARRSGGPDDVFVMDSRLRTKVYRL